MQSTSAQDVPDMETTLRDHLLARRAGVPTTSASPYPPPPAGVPDHPYQASVPADQPDDAAMRLDYSMDEMNELRKGKRELSTSKRAAQNRAAQRAFRQRKEGYIKKLEEQVKEFESMEQGYRTLQNENYQLREYILTLQSRLLDQPDVPPAPAHISLGQGTAPPPVDGEAALTEQRLRRELLQHDAKTADRADDKRPSYRDDRTESPAEPPAAS